MAEAAVIRHKRRVAADRAKITWNRHQVLRRSSTGRLLLALERCAALVVGKGKSTSRRLSALLDELSYACELADEAGVQNGWIRDGEGTFSLVFALSSGDVVFSELDETLGADPFPRQPIAAINSLVLSRAITEFLSQEKHCSPRRSTRMFLHRPVKVEGAGVEYSGETITVNLHGALVRVAAPLRLGDRVTVHVHHTGKSAPGAVVFAKSGMSQFGIELQNPENIWGVSIPPSDWNTHSSETS